MASPTDPSVLTQVFGNDIRKDFAPLYPAWLRLSEKFKAGIATPTEIDELDRLNQIVLGRGPANNNKGRASTKAASRAPVSDRIVPRLFQGLMSRFGLTREQAAGVVGNLAHESQGFTDLTEDAPVVPGSRGGYGIAQWTGPRRRAYEAWSRQNGLDPASSEANEGFLFHELETTERATLDRLRQARTAEEATRIFSDSFLRPGIPAMDSRQAFTRQMLAYAPNQQPIPGGPPPRPAPRLPPLMDETTQSPFGNPLFPTGPSQRPPAGDGSRVQTASLSPGPTPTQTAGLNLINGAQGTLATLAKRVLPPAPVINSGSFGGSLNMESQSLPMTNKVAGDKLASNARSTLASIANMPPANRYTGDSRFSNPEWMTGNPSQPGIGLGMDMPTPRIADVGSHLAPIPPMRPDNMGTGGPDISMPPPAPPQRPGSLGTRSNPVGTSFTPPTRTAAIDPLVGLLNTRFPVPANPGTGGPLAAPLPPPLAAPRPSSFAPGSPEIARYAAMYAPFAQRAAPVTQQPEMPPLPIPRPVAPAQPTSSQRQAAPRAPALSPQQIRQSSAGSTVGSMNGNTITKIAPGKYVDASGRRVYLQN